MVDIPSTYGALLLGGLAAAGYVTIYMVDFLLMVSPSKPKVIGRSHGTSLCVSQTLPPGYGPHKDHGTILCTLLRPSI